jgi:GntR family transcriptional regulator
MPPAVKSTRTPLARQIAEDLRRRIVAGEFPPGSRLPSESDLCDRYGVSRVTVRTAAKALESQGLVDIRHGSGMFVVDFGGRIRSGLQELRSITQTIEELGLNATVRRVSLTRRRADDVERARLDLADDEEVVAVQREIKADDQVVAVSIDSIPARLVPASEDASLGHGSVFAVLDRIGLDPTRALAEIHAVRGSELPITPNSVEEQLLLLLDQVHYDRSGQPVAYSKTYFVEGRFQFVILRTR